MSHLGIEGIGGEVHEKKAKRMVSGAGGDPGLEVAEGKRRLAEGACVSDDAAIIRGSGEHSVIRSGWNDNEDRTMKGKRFRNEQIIYALKRVEGGEKAREVCRQMGVSEPTFYLWKKKFSGMGVSELSRLRQLEEENGRLKKLVADLSLDKHILQEVVAKKL